MPRLASAWGLVRALLLLTLSARMLAAADRVSTRLDEGWNFHLGDVAGAQDPAVAPEGWRPVRLPHDWSIALAIDPSAPAGGSDGFFPAGVGWYRRALAVPAAWAHRHVELEFEGVAGLAEVWLNGQRLGSHAYAYTPFQFDLTPYLRPGTDNLLSVRVDNSAQPAARWYSGSGLYRPVLLWITDPVHVAAGSVFAETAALTAGRATVRVRSAVVNETDTAHPVQIETTIRDERGLTVAAVVTAGPLEARGALATAPELQVAHPRPWSPDSPCRYQVVVRVRVDGRPTDEVTAWFGVRTIAVSAERGFELNGRPLKLLGGDVHHDNGVLGAAAFDRAEERKVELLQAAGFNAVRTAHNPPSVAFLEACDRRGLLVMDEIFDGWAKPKTRYDFSVHFADEWPGEVDAWIRRDRNHPSVVLWSEGNEMFERGDENGRRIVREIAARIRALDPSRPLTAGVNNLGKNGDWTNLDPLFAPLDVAGYNYELARAEADHARLPARVIVGTEVYQGAPFADWSVVRAHPYVIGAFVWSALDYLGEAGLGRVFPGDQPARKPWEANMYPWHGAGCGDLDLTGWRKPISHYRNLVWDRGERLYAAVGQPPPGGKPWNLTPWSVAPALPAWTWACAPGTPLTVEVYSRHEAVRLTLNGRVIGEQPTTAAEQFRATFTVPYAPGELRAVGLRHGQEAEQVVLRTAAASTALRLTADRNRLRVGGQDLAFVTLEAVDADGVWNPTSAAAVDLAVTGSGTLAGAGTGDMTSLDSYVSGRLHLFQGRALAVVRTGGAAGEILLGARTPGLPAAALALRSAQP